MMRLLAPWALLALLLTSLLAPGPFYRAAFACQAVCYAAALLGLWAPAAPVPAVGGGGVVPGAQRRGVGRLLGLGDGAHRAELGSRRRTGTARSRLLPPGEPGASAPGVRDAATNLVSGG